MLFEYFLKLVDYWVFGLEFSGIRSELQLITLPGEPFYSSLISGQLGQQVGKPLGVAAGEVAYGARALLQIEQFVLLQNALNLARDCRRRIDHAHALTADLLDQRNDEGKVGAAHHQGIHALLHHRQNRLFQNPAGFGRGQIASFNLPDQTRTSCLKKLNILGEPFHNRGVHLSLEG